MKDYTEPILGLGVTQATLDACIDRILRGLGSRAERRVVACLNPHSIVLARRDPVFSMALRDADIVVPDGTGIVFASRILGGAIRERITGSDIFREVNLHMNRRGGYRCFFLGSTYKNLERIRDKFSRQYPNVEIVGMYSPPFKPDFDENDTRDMVAAVNAARPDVLWVGMSAPKQEKWIYLNRRRLDAALIAAVGAVFDFYVGTVKRAPRWFLDHGLEWLPRLIQEPRRLWRRNLVSTPLFLSLVLHEKRSRFR